MEHIVFAPAGQRILDGGGAIEQLCTGFSFTEGPVWSKKEEQLYFTNFSDNTIHTLRPGEKPVLFRENSGRAVGLSIRKDGTIVSAETSSHAVTLAYADHSEIIAGAYGGKKLNSPNDVIVRRDGAVLFTDPYSVPMGGPRHQDYNAFYIVPQNPDGTYGEASLLDTMERPNGLAYSPDESILYVNDTNHNFIHSYAMHADNTVSYIGLFARLDKSYGPGAADGMKVDAEGNVYVTGPGGIWVFDPSGSPLVLLRMPEYVGNFCFGGADGRTLFVTASTSVYSMRTGIPGILP